MTPHQLAEKVWEKMYPERAKFVTLAKEAQEEWAKLMEVTLLEAMNARMVVPAAIIPMRIPENIWGAIPKEIKKY